ncbi:MAG: ROK family protein [Acidimicrobiia bacterium]|nr:ROK family protein [Acidimicrobiia bacterium]
MTWIGIDLGGTKVYGVVVHNEKVKQDAKRKTPTSGGPAAVVDTIAAVIDDLGGTEGIKGVGIGAPGAVDHEAGVVKQAPNLAGWQDNNVPLGSLVSKAVGGLPVYVENDANVGTLAEHRLGAGKGTSDVLGVWVGTGVGGGLILNGKLRRGPTGYAGEIGHTVVVEDGRLCGCGHKGHLEAYAGRASLEREARARAAAGAPNMLVELAGDGRMTSKIWADALDARDPCAIELIDGAVAALGVAVADAVTLLDLDLIVVGGGLADRLGPTFVGRIEQAAREQIFAHGSPARVVPAALGDQSGALGAALMAADSA